MVLTVPAPVTKRLKINQQNSLPYHLLVLFGAFSGFLSTTIWTPLYIYHVLVVFTVKQQRIIKVMLCPIKSTQILFLGSFEPFCMRVSRLRNLSVFNIHKTMSICHHNN